MSKYASRTLRNPKPRGIRTVLRQRDTAAELSDALATLRTIGFAR